jgi:hypothetical protein
MSRRSLGIVLKFRSSRRSMHNFVDLPACTIYIHPPDCYLWSGGQTTTLNYDHSTAMTENTNSSFWHTKPLLQISQYNSFWGYRYNVAESNKLTDPRSSPVRLVFSPTETVSSPRQTPPCWITRTARRYAYWIVLRHPCHPIVRDNTNCKTIRLLDCAAVSKSDKHAQTR